MATVLLRPEERPSERHDPKLLMVAIAIEYEALRAYVRENRDLDPARLLQQARRSSRAILRLALAVSKAERQAVTTPVKPSQGQDLRPFVVSEIEATPVSMSKNPREEPLATQNEIDGHREELFRPVESPVQGSRRRAASLMCTPFPGLW